jgi:transcriptional regulator with XRE-family HTH domain
MIREARLERHLSMGQLAAAVDRSTASVRRWERDDGLPSPDVVDILILRLDLDPDEVAAALAPAVDEPVEQEIEQGDPIDVVPLADVAEAVEAGPMEWKQPAIEPLPAPPPTPRPVTLAPAPTMWATASQPVAVIERDQNFLQVLRDPDKPWLGYIRAALTVAVLVGLVWVLLWAVPEFFDAFGKMWDSLWPKAEGTIQL